jgi:hypothetical protein
MKEPRPRKRKRKRSAAITARTFIIESAVIRKAVRQQSATAIAIFFLAPALAWAGQAGVIELAEGEVQITSTSGEVVTVRTAQPISEGDTVATGKTGEVHFRMEDQALIAVRPNTRMRIDAYRARGDKDDNSALSLLQGTFRVLTGWIGRYNRERYRIQTATTTIGIRGTDHEPAYLGADTTPAERDNHPPGTYDKVNAGETFMQNAAGKISVTQGRAGFAPDAATRAPQLLERTPAFYRKTRNELTFESKREQQAKDIETKRIERIVKVREETRGAGQSKDGDKSGAEKKGTARKRATPKREGR